jgi:hypothetical protein
MKLSLYKNLRIALIVIIIIITGIISFLLYRELAVPTFEEQKIPQFSYINNGLINYKVYLKPNNLYEEYYLEEGRLYIYEFVDHILTEFSYEFSGDKDAQIAGTYDITAQIQGFTGDGEKRTNLWQKNIPILSNKRINSNNNSVSLKEETKINIEEYNTYAKEIIESSKVSCQTSLNILFDINLKAVTEKGTVEEKVSPSLIIPLNTSMFEVKSNNIQKPGSIDDTIQVQLPVNKAKVIFYGIIIGISALGLIFLIIFTKVAPEKDPLEKELNKIFKKHGDRLVALSSEVDISNARTVRTIDDLVRLADEINKPILYKYSDDYKEINNFFITNDDEIYVFDLEDLIPKEEEKTSEQLTVDIEQ